MKHQKMVGNTYLSPGILGLCSLIEHTKGGGSYLLYSDLSVRNKVVVYFVLDYLPAKRGWQFADWLEHILVNISQVPF